MAWRYFAVTVNGDGTETLLAEDLPLSGVSITKAVSAADVISFDVTPEIRRLQRADGRPILRARSTAVYAELDGVIRAGGIVKSTRADGSSLKVDCPGFVSLIDGEPWTNSTIIRYGADPADIIRTIWAYWQAHPRANVGMTIPADVSTTGRVGSKTYDPVAQPADTVTSSTKKTASESVVTTVRKNTVLRPDGNTVTTTTTVRRKPNSGPATTTKTVVEKTTRTTREVTTVTKTYNAAGQLSGTSTVTSTVAASAKITTAVAPVKDDEPFVLANYATTDLGDVFHDMLEAGPLDYREVHEWAGGKVAHRLDLGSPRLGRRRTDITFQTGVNVTDLPEVEFDADDYASEVLVLGAGEGDKMVRASAANPDVDRIRRVKVIPSKGIGRQATAATYAAKWARMFNTDEGDIDQLVVADHPMAPLLAWDAGDEVHLSGDMQWGGRVNMWVRILETTIQPGTSAGAVLKVARADKT